MANRTPKKKLTLIPKLISEKRGNVSAIARELSITRGTLNNIIKADSALVELLADERERMLDNAEDRLGMAVDNGEAWAVCFTLKTQGKERGYTERSEITGKDGKDLVPRRFEVEIVSDSTSTSDQD